jgi:CRISPR-associated protein Cas5d
MGYGIAIRVRGEYALFTRPELKVERVSYDVITPSAARGIIESVYWKPAINWVIDRVHVLREPEFTNIRRNEVSEKASMHDVQQVMNGANKALYIDINSVRQQRAALVLRNVDYIIEAHFELVSKKAGADDTVAKHYNMALRRLRKGQFYSAPCLGTREYSAQVDLVDNCAFPPSPLTGNRDLGWMLYDMDFTNPSDIRPMFFKAELQNGVMDLTKVRPAR